MKKLSLLTLILSSFFAFSQSNNQIKFKSGNVIPADSFSEALNMSAFNKDELVNGNYYRLIQFNSIPSEATKEQLLSLGVNLVYYIPSNAFIAEIKREVDLNQLVSYGAIWISKLETNYKLSKKLFNKAYDDWALNGANIKINAVAFNTLSNTEITKALNSVGASIISLNYANIAQVELPIVSLESIYALPHFHYFEQVDAPGEPENLVGVTNHRSNNLATSYSTGLKYDGTGVVVMLQDNSMLDDHIDYTGRFFDINSTQSGDHGEHCGGTIAGAGNLDPTTRGMAYGADVLVYDPDNNNYNFVPTIYTNDDVRITSKSYSNGVNAGYTSLAQQLDQQTRQMPDLVHVFSAGNSNGSGSTAAGSQWFNITGGHKAGKNVITVANVTREDVINSSSSRGPCEDGRIKPDISAVGTDVTSTIDPNTYASYSGTSMACPGVAGTLAQLYHAYKDMNAGANPPSGLIKGTVLNTADDIGNSGPDFIYGWGRINARRAYNLLSNNNYLSASISQGGNNVHNVTVPAGTDQVRIMVYWTDYEGAVSASPALVNDINMVVTDPNTTTYDPWVLDATPNATTLNLPAVRGVDNLNNMEQVTIDNPVAGTYDIDISGFSIPQGPQTYYVVYEFVTDDVVLTYPIGGEGFDPNVDEKIRWDAYGNSGTFDLEYSDNNGTSWNLIATGINASDRYYDWNVPNIVTGEALVRITRGASTSQSHEPFSIIGVPTGLSVNWHCPDSMEVEWNPIAGATGYEVSLLGNKYMDSVGTAVGQTTLVIYAPANQSHWWSVKALGPNNCVGRRAIAVYQASGTFNCVLPTDAELSSLQPGDGSHIASCMMSIDSVTIDVINNGQSAITNVPVSYSFNGGGAVNETVPGPIGVGNTVTYTFTTQILPITGNNTLLVWSSLAGDGNPYNDSLYSEFTYSNASPESLPWTEDFESFILCGTASDCEMEECLLKNEFVNEKNGLFDDIDWRTDNNGTPSNNTGPNVDFDPGNVVGKYLYTEASGGCNGQEASLISPCIDLTNVTAANLSFAYHMFGGDMGQLRVDLYMNGSWINNIAPVINGDQGNIWKQSFISLNTYTGNVINLRFRGITGSGFESDIAIDAISVTEPVGQEELFMNNNISLFPNPANDKLNISGLSSVSNLSIEVFNTIGELVLVENKFSEGLMVLDINKLNKGIYFVRVSSDDLTLIEKFIKE